ncbi:ABC transporter ATP-binding protein [Nesterenkonia pannonica]|uniref:ABC transporter ATP-binding protein n=1 Tax=Nesterenkonia pannonica TaxID=1548602 RepID=UPI0021647928|nr:ABC transporter ATP-binding protein [Nesterenkonia pannonica]
MGIVGRNGAGKSTLLKLLTRVTAPTQGRIELHGRVGSLLEVGTGFHPELTGKENIYLNGSILGMSRREIKKRYDEIVEFSGIERFLATPVKRYSSGMQVRLAFSVAAHLDTEILAIDEVLAVGDAEFQRRSIAKMREAAMPQENRALREPPAADRAVPVQLRDAAGPRHAHLLRHRRRDSGRVPRQLRELRPGPARR